mmetsp:Transcript_11750/g.21153  ORF Transcript_11750/g.21153 Transcript_11750/m.21153 type:complete len:272 (-) Transcript_11750:75-890(-)
MMWTIVECLMLSWSKKRLLLLLCTMISLWQNRTHLIWPGTCSWNQHTRTFVEVRWLNPLESMLNWLFLFDSRLIIISLDDSAIYVTRTEFKRFRQLVVNGIMATDIVDKDLKKLRNDRWDAAFADSDQGPHVNEDRSRILKATIVIEHLIQASDVAHTMQHWHVYRRWNERFFQECYQAYKDGRAEKDPSETWYQGELGFFDFYIIPLAKKLKECGVFGVSSDEYLSYALQNRTEWEERGKGIVEEMISKVHRQNMTLSLPDLGNGQGLSA